jgi:hypothetical protein
VIDGGPDGAFFAQFMQDMTTRAEGQVEVAIYEPCNFDAAGPKGFNGCDCGFGVSFL